MCPVVVLDMLSATSRNSMANRSPTQIPEAATPGDMNFAEILSRRLKRRNIINADRADLIESWNIGETYCPAIFIATCCVPHTAQIKNIMIYTEASRFLRINFLRVRDSIPFG